MLLDQARI